MAKPLNAKITVTFLASNQIDQDTLDDWYGEGDGITFEEYVEFMVKEQRMLFDIVDGDYEYVCCESI